MDKVLQFIAETLQENGVNYHYEEYKTNKVEYPYSIGSITPTIPASEDGRREYNLSIDTFHRGSRLELLEAVEKIENAFDYVEGMRSISGDTSIVAYTLNSQPVPTGDADLQRIKTQINIKTWKGRA